MDNLLVLFSAKSYNINMTNKKILYTLGVVIIISILMVVFSYRDEQIKLANDKYFDCVKNIYQMSPAEYRNKTGELPECDFNK